MGVAVTNSKKLLVAGIGAAAITAAVVGNTVIESVVPGDVTLVSDWTFEPTDLDAAELVQSPARSQLAWEVPGTFTNGTDSFSGDLFIRPTGGSLMQPDFQFDIPNSGETDISPDSAMYAYGSPTGSGYFVGAYFFSPQGTSNITGSNAMFITDPANNTGIQTGSGGSWLLGPAPYSDAITGSEALGTFGTVGSDGSISVDAGSNGNWLIDPGTDENSVMYDNVPIWHWADATLAEGSGDPTDGQLFMNTNGLSGYNLEFVGNNDSLYNFSQWGFGFTNMYFDPGDGSPVEDILKTPFGDMNLSWLSWAFTPADYSSSTDGGSALADLLTNNASTLGDTFEFGQQTIADTASAVSSSAADAISGLG